MQLPAGSADQERRRRIDPVLGRGLIGLRERGVGARGGTIPKRRRDIQTRDSVEQPVKVERCYVAGVLLPLVEVEQINEVPELVLGAAAAATRPAATEPGPMKERFSKRIWTLPVRT